MSPQLFFNIRNDDFRAHYPAFSELRSISMATGDAAIHEVIRRLWRSVPVPSMADGNPAVAIHTFLQTSLHYSAFS